MKSDPTAPKRDGDLPRDRNAQKRDLSLTDQATRLVRDHILNLTLEPGVTLDERQVMERFRSAEHPCREAMNRLIAEGFVVRKDQRGIQVMPLDIPTAVELLDAYVMNERVVASMLRFSDPGVVEELREIQAMYVRSLSPANLAKVTEINTKFHNRLAQATQNVYIVDQSTKLNRLAQRLSYYIFRREATNDLRIPLLFDNPRKGHDLIIKHIENHDREMLVKELTDHATFFRTRLARIINEDRGKDINFVGLVLDF